MSKRKERIFLKGFSDVPPFFLLLALLLPALDAQAVDKSWVGGSGWWDFAWNWSPSGQPAYDDNVYLTQSDAVDRIVWYWNTVYSSAVLRDLRIDATGTGTITLSQGRDLLSSNYEYIGYNGTGTFTQSGGTNAVTSRFYALAGWLYLGYTSTGSGTYDLSGTGSLSASTEYIGNFGTGTFTQSGSTYTVTHHLYLGYHSTGSGTYHQSGGMHTVTNELYLGYDSTASGAYDLSGGDLSAASETIGDSGTGSVTQSGGTNRVTNYLVLGYHSTGNGTYNLSGGSLSARSEIIGLSGTGSFPRPAGGTR